MYRSLTRLLFDREYAGDISFDLNGYDLIDDYNINNLDVISSIIMAILHDLSTVDHRLHISEFSRNAIQSEIIELITNAASPQADDCIPDGSTRLTNLDYREIRSIAAELSTLPSIEPLYRALRRAVRNIAFSPHDVKYVHDNIIVLIHIL